MGLAVTLIAVSALDATGILGARETLASGADSSENIRQSGGSIDDVEYVGRRPGEYGYTRFRRVDARATAKCRALQVVSYLWCPSGSSSRDSSEEWKNADVRGDRLPERAPARLVAGAESSDAGFGRTVIRGPVAEVARAGGNTPAASDYIEGGDVPEPANRARLGHLTRRGCADNRRGLAYYSRHASAWLELRGVHSKPTLWFPKFSCDFIRRAVQLVRSRAQKARRSYEAWHAAQWVLREQRTWRAAVEHVQRAYPGTEDWLLSCSSTEGGHGRWVPNSQGFPPGGWMQFYRSTWVRMFGLEGYSGALQDLARRGFKVDPKTHSWYSPVGQALAGAWGLTHGRVGEWNSSGC